MRFIFFDPPYSNFFNDLGLKLKGQGHEVTWIGSPVCDWFFYPNLASAKRQSTNISCHISDEELAELVVSTPSLANHSKHILTSREVYLICRHIRRYLKRINLTDIGIFYNDCRWNHAVLIAIFRKLKIRYFVFERGPIRSLTCSVDSCGVNARSKFYNAQQLSSPSNEIFDLSPRKQVPFLRSRFVIYYILRLISDNLLSLRGISNNKPDKLHYLKLLLGKFKKRNINPKINYIDKLLVALQIESDSQIVLGSSFNSNQEFIDFVVREASNLALGEKKILFKQHPLDTNEYEFYGHEVLPLHQSIELAHLSGIITINSTMGFEGLLNNVPVLTLGESFYTRDNWVYCERDICRFMTEAMLPKSTSEEIMAAVLGNYAMPGDIFNYCTADLEFISAKILAEIQE